MFIRLLLTYIYRCQIQFLASDYIYVKHVINQIGANVFVKQKFNIVNKSFYFNNLMSFYDTFRINPL